MILVLLVANYANRDGTAKIFEHRQGALQRVRPLLDLLEHHYAEPIHLHDAAAILGMSESHFTHFFRELTGQSFVTYLNHLRVAHAQELLTLPDKSVSQVSQEVGFCDQSYFGRVFRTFTRLTPRQYQRKYKRLAIETLTPLIKQTSRDNGGPKNGQSTANQKPLTV
jgi:AraC-like DNA-binding protein